MASKVQIEVTLDNSGVLTGVKAIEGQLNSIKTAGSDAGDKVSEGMSKMESSSKEAHEALLLIAETTGVQIPRAVEKVIAATPGISNALKAGFSSAAIIGVIAATAELLSNWDELETKAIDIGMKIEAIFDHDMRQTLENAKLDKLIQPMIDKTEQLKAAAETAGTQGFGAIAAQSKVALDQVTQNETKYLNQQAETYGRYTDTYKQLEAQAAGQVRQQRTFIEEQTNKEIAAARAKLEEDIRQQMIEAESITASQIQQIRAQGEGAQQNISFQARTQGIPSAQVAQMRAAATEKTNNQILLLYRDYADQLQQIMWDAETQTVDGVTKIDLEGENQKAALLLAFHRKFGNDDSQISVEAHQQLQQTLLAIDEQTAAKREQIEKEHAAKLAELDQEAALATVPYWDKATAQIELDGQKQLTAWEEYATKQKLTVQQEAQGEIDIRTATNAKLLEEQRQLGNTLGSQFQSIFDDITSGNIGKRILKDFETFFFNILGQWAATMRGIRQTAAAPGGLFGALLGSILGVGNGQAVGAGGGTGPYGLPAGVASSFGEFDNGSLFPAGAGVLLGAGAGGGFGGLNVSLGAGSSSSSSSILASVLNASVGAVGLGTKSSSGSGGILGNLLSAQSLSKLAPLAVLGSLVLGSKGGASAIAAGGLIGALGLGALYGPNTAATIAALPYAGLLGPLAGGLIGFGVGSMTGSPALGGVSGAGSGALIGLLAGGPVGALIGGIIGGLAGIFGGLFGGSPSKHSLADKYINASVLPLIQQEVTNYEGFQTDFATAINDLETLKTSSYAQMKQQFGTDATNDEYNKYVAPAIATAEQRINTDQAERNRRSTLQFGPPQFDLGGMYLSSRGSGLAVLHDGEVVMGRRATAAYGASTLLAMNDAANRGGAPMMGGGEIHIHVHTMDTKTFSQWLKSGAGTEIAKHFRGRTQEGKSGF